MQIQDVDFLVTGDGRAIDVRGLYGFRYISLLTKRPWNARVFISSAAEEQLPARSGGIHMQAGGGPQPPLCISLPRS